MSIESTLATTAAQSLRGLCGGAVHLPGDPSYDAQRAPWNVAVDQRPAAVAIPRHADDVVDVVRAAASAGLRVAPQSTGHAARPLADGGLDDVVLLRLSELIGVSVDPQARVARILGGTLWRDVVAAVAPHGLGVLHGSAPDVAVAGYTLGGGLSFYARQHGLACSWVSAVEVVTADGTLVRADAEHHSDLFWAVRGGGGSFGVVVALELRLLELADVQAGMLLWPRDRAPEVVRAWARWTRGLPESVTTSLRVMSLPPLPELPPFLSGRQLVVIDGAVLEDDERAAELLAPLRALDPELDTFARVPTPAVTQIHMDPPGPTPAVGAHAMLGSFGDDAVAALLAEVGDGSASSLLFAEVRHLGGAVARPAPGGGALSRIASPYLLQGIAVAPTPEIAAAGLADAERLVAAMSAWCTPEVALNFTEATGRARDAFDPDVWARLAWIRAGSDPQGLFVANHPVAG
ncbi:FAD-binding oxidoreductase [Nocardioides pacificus]